MDEISEFAQRMMEHNARVDAAIIDIERDLAALKQLIADLQANVVQITPEDQALLDQIEGYAIAATAKVEALDALTPPNVPNP